MLCNLSKPRPRQLRRPALILLVSLSTGWVAISSGDRAAPATDNMRPAAKVDMPFAVPPGFVAERIVGPPLVEHPMFACFDEQGRLFVADSLGVNPAGEQLRDKPAQVIRVLEDADGDGRYDKSTIFADKLTYPEGIAWHEGAIYTAA